MTTTGWRHRHRDTGSVSIELAIITPAVLALLATAVIAGRVNLARQSIEAAAFDAARTASLARTKVTAQAEALAAATSTLTAQGLHCSSISVAVNTTGFDVPVGAPATVTVIVTCQATFSDVALAGMPGRATLSASFTSPLDTYRSRG
ncbi:TadE/TadG family type IV pilus assembly protein [Dactylosporangium sucinum]|uniref:Membrane protein n=1 Tax=Dactylosporangium sucinum TaxID=1424081 RepID=A0A917TIQ8_9ACTN|nr:TadE/TadG family type IV pilus assembly protein [Dactylosporangium sucinum]GGM23805.1 membrane protein [Dactylosporangium sucinum]